MKKILAIEDREDSGLILKMILEKKCELHLASSLVEARRELLSFPPQLIFLDGNLPDGDGFNFCKWLKNNPRYQKIPVIMLTGRNEESEKEFCLSLGADEYLVKPVRSAVIKELVAKYLGITF